MNKTGAVRIETWFRDKTEERGMEPDHAYLWRHFADAVIAPDDWHGKTVLDYGCNSGGFLSYVYEKYGFDRGIGVDVASHALNAAHARCMGMPLVFDYPECLATKYRDAIDLAFSHEVVYLLPDLAEHAALMAGILRYGGSYDIAIGCHTQNPLWAHWRRMIADTTHLPVFDYSLDDYAQALWRAGFDVSMKPFAYEGFVGMKPSNAYFPSVTDSLRYHTQDKVLIHAVKRGGQ